MPEELIPIIAILSFFGYSAFRRWMAFRLQVLELQGQNRSRNDTGVRAELEALRQEVMSLRETTLQYDLSFDASLERMENRVEGIERRINTNERSSNDPTITLGVRR